VAHFRFGAFELDTVSQELRRDGARVRLAPQPAQILRLLTSRAGEVVSRDEIRREVWGDSTFVDFDRSLNVAIRQIRQALRDNAETPRYLETIPKRGYRFIAAVESGALIDSGSAPRPKALRTIDRRWLLASPALIAAGAVGGHWLRRLPGRSSDRAILAVLPLENLTGDSTDEAMAEGLSEELITQLGTALPSRLGVIARTSVQRFRKDRPSVTEIAARLGAQYLVEGTLRRAGDRARLSVRLIAASGATPIWTETIDTTGNNAIELQQHSAARISAGILASLYPSHQTVPAKRYTPSRQAWEAYRSGRYLQQSGGPPARTKALEYFEEAVRLDPRFADAWAAVAEMYLVFTRTGRPTPDNFARVREAAGRALETESRHADAQNALANVLFWHDWKWREAEQSFQRALEWNPSLAIAHHDIAWLLLSRGRPNEAINALDRALALDPLSPRINIDAGWMNFYAGRFKQAAEQARRTLELEPGMTEANLCTARALLCSGDFGGALRAMLAALPPEAVPVAKGKNPRDAIAAIYRWQLQRGVSSAHTRAVLLTWLGEKTAALDALEESFAKRQLMLPLIGSDPSFQTLRGEPRFQALLAKIA